MTPCIKRKIWYINGQLFKIVPNLSQNWLKFKKILEKSGDFAQNLSQNRADWYMNVLIFLEKLVFVWSTFKFRGGTSLPKPNLSTPGGNNPPPPPPWKTCYKNKNKKKC